MLSIDGIPQGEWRLNHGTVSLIWERFGKVEVDLFMTEENTHCPLFFSLSLTMLGQRPVCTLSPIEDFVTGAAQNQRGESVSVVSGSELAESALVPDLLEILMAPPWLIPLRWDLLSQVGGSIWHPNHEWWKLHVWMVCRNR